MALWRIIKHAVVAKIVAINPNTKFLNSSIFNQQVSDIGLFFVVVI